MRKCSNKRDGLTAGIMLFPFLLLLLIIYVYPILDNIWISLTNYSGLKIKGYRFVGLANYKAILGGSISGFPELLAWTIIFAASVVCISFLLGLFIAVLLEKENIAVARIYRGIFILPWVIPSVVTLLLWRGFLSNDGVVNKILSVFGLGKVPWLTNPLLARISSIFVMVWFSFPYFIIVAQGILKSISPVYYEAARIDGASSVKIFFRLTIPFVIRSMLPTLIMAFIMQFNQFGMYMLTEGGPTSDTLGAPGKTDLLITYVFNLAFNNDRYDLAAAYAFIIFIFVGLFTLAAMKVGKKVGSEE